MGIRSLLFVPGTRSDRFDKAMQSEADAVAIDLEDAVGINEKAPARQQVGIYIRGLQAGRMNGKQLYVRINGMNTPFWREDLREVLGDALTGIMLPKSESASQILELVETIQAVTERDEFVLMPLIETARGVLQAQEIAAAHQWVKQLCFGSIDYATDVGIDLSPSGEELLVPRTQIALASAAAQLAPPLDAVYPELDNEAGLLAECRRAKQLGFGGKMAIHPKQLGPILRVFQPTSQEIEWAQEVVAAYEEALSRGEGAIQVKGKFIDEPVYKRALSVLGKR